MSDTDQTHQGDRFWPSSVPSWVRTVGMTSWMFAGMAAAIWVFSYAMSLSSGIMVPLIVAFVIGIVAYPLVEWLQKHKVAPAWGGLIVLALLIVIIVAVVWVTAAGVISQWPQIYAQVLQGVQALKSSLASLGIGDAEINSLVNKATSASGEAAKSASSGVLSAVGSGFSSVLGLIFGLFIGAVLLYYVLSDFPTLADYIDTHLGLPSDLGHGVAMDGADSLRGYFKGTTITGLVVAVAIGAGALLLGVPLVIPITLVTFLTCYIPFFGSILSGAFAFLVALGAKGPTAAFIILVVVLLAQNLLQTVVNARVMGTSLNLHPLVVLVVTMLGGIFAGLLGATLAAPALAMVLRADKRIRLYREAAAKKPSAAPTSGPSVSTDPGTTPSS